MPVEFQSADVPDDAEVTRATTETPVYWTLRFSAAVSADSVAEDMLDNALKTVRAPDGTTLSFSKSEAYSRDENGKWILKSDATLTGDTKTDMDIVTGAIEAALDGRAFTMLQAELNF